MLSKIAGLSTGLRVARAVLVLVIAVSCGGTTPTAPTQASITLSVTPSPVTAVLCHPTCLGPSGRAYPFQASMTVTVQESARISGNLDFINVAPVADDGTELPVLGYGADVITQRSGSNHVGPSGILSFPLSFLYSTGTSGAHLVLTVSIQFTDDKGNRLTSSLQVNVTDPTPVSTDSGGIAAPAAARFLALAEAK